VIDWLTRRQTHGALHDKPLTVIGRATRCYSAVWSPGQIDYARGISGSRVVESITVPTLREAVSVNAVRNPGCQPAALTAWQVREDPGVTGHGSRRHNLSYMSR
jgi:hypothetical protein